MDRLSPYETHTAAEIKAAASRYESDRIAELEAQLEAERKDGEKNAKRVKWMLPLLGGDDSPEADKRTLLLANELMRGKSGLEAIDAALEATTPEKQG